MEWGKPPRAEKLWSLFTVSKKRIRWEVNFTELCSQQTELRWIKLITKALNLSSKQKVLGVSADKKLSGGDHINCIIIPKVTQDSRIVRTKGTKATNRAARIITRQCYEIRYVTSHD